MSICNFSHVPFWFCRQDLVLIVSVPGHSLGFTYVLVICNHAPPAPGNNEDLTFVFQSSATLWEVGNSQLVKPMQFSPAVCYVFICTAFFAYITQIPGISPALRVQCKSKNTAHFQGYRPPSLGAWGAWLQMTSAL